MNDPSINQLLSLLKNDWNNYWQKPKKSAWRLLKKNLFALLPSYNDPFWNYHFAFEEKPHHKPIKLIGEELKKEIIINVCLPWLYDEISQENRQDQQKAFREFYASFSSSTTKKSTYLSHRFFDDDEKENLLKRADIQQGAYQIHRDYCLHYEASCIGCPFVDRFETYAQL